jgi:hypothetical protein
MPAFQAAGDYALRFFDWTRSSALNSVAMTYDSNQRGGYMQAIKANARAAVQQIDALGPTRIPEVTSVARSASAFRDAARTATQQTLTPWGKFMSRRIEGNANVPFEDRMTHREAKLTEKLGRAPAEFELLKGVATGAGYSNKWVSRFASGARILGPIMTVGQVGMVGSQVYQAAPEDRLRVAGREGFKLSSNLLYGALGSIAGVAGAGLLLASPLGPALGAYAGITYLAASLGGGIAGGMVGGVVSDRILGPN